MNYYSAQRRLKNLKSFYKHCIIYSIIAAIILTRNIIRSFENDSLFQGSLILTIWGIILIMKACRLFIFDEKWENKILRNELEKEQKHF